MNNTPENHYTNLVITGIVGGVAAGKSTAAEMLAEMGAEIIDADRVTHQELEKPGPAKRLVGVFGEEILDENGKVNRKALSELAFKNRRNLDKLTEIIHPGVISEISAKLSDLNRKDRPVPVVLEAALLIESGLDRICDFVLFIQCSLKARLWRARNNRQWNEKELKKRESFQLILNEKKSASTHVINNNLTPARLRYELEDFWKNNIDPAITKKTGKEK